MIYEAKMSNEDEDCSMPHHISRHDIKTFNIYPHFTRVVFFSVPDVYLVCFCRCCQQHEELPHPDQLYQGPRAITGTVSGSLLSSLGGECDNGCHFTASIYYNLLWSVCCQSNLVGR